MNPSPGSRSLGRFLLTALSISFVSFLFFSPVAAAAGSQSVQVNLGPIQNLSNSPNASTAPTVAAVGSHVYVAWEEKVPNQKHQTFFMYSADNGSTWSTPFQFAMVGGASPQTSAVQIAAAGNYVFLTWEQNNQTAYAISSNNGVTFKFNIINVTSSLAGSMSGQSVATCGSYAYFSWSDVKTAGGRPILFASAHDNGLGAFTFTVPKALSSTFSSHLEDEIKCVGNNVYDVWDSIYFVRSLNNGVTWSTSAKQLAPPGGVFGSLSREPMLAASGSDVYVTFPSNSNGAYQAYIAVSHDSGTTWATAKIVSVGMTSTREVQVLASGSNVWVTTRGKDPNTGGTQEYVYTSNDDGNTFTAPILVGGAKMPNPESGFGGLASYGSDVYVQWIHNPPGKAFKGIQQIFLSASQDNGATWGMYQQLSQSTGGTIGYGDPSGGQGPQVAANSGMVFSVWVDLTTNAGDVYFVASALPTG